MLRTSFSRAQAKTYIERLARARVCVVGDAMLDRYFWGEVERISPEAPVPVVHISRKSVRLGGAANVAANLGALGARVALAAVTGDDSGGQELRQLLGERGIGVEHVCAQANHPTTEKVRIIARSQQVVRADFEAPFSVNGEAAQVLAGIASLHGQFDALVVSDYGKGFIEEKALREIIAAWRSGGKPVLVDPHVGHYRWYRGATIITPNTKEAASYFSGAHDRARLFDAMGFQMIDELDLEALLITRGEEGMTLLERGGSRTDVPTVAKEVFDVTGAGDTVIGVLAAALGAGVPLADAVVLSNQAAGEVVKEVGTSVITPDKLLSSFV